MKFKDFCELYEDYCNESDDSLNWQTSEYYAQKANNLADGNKELFDRYLNT